MDEYLSEKEQIELIRQWWRENGWFLVGGAAVAALGYFGYGAYQRYQATQSEEAAALYLNLLETLEDDREGADALLARLQDDYGSTPYEDQARLVIAREVLVSDPARAAAELRRVSNESDDPGVAMIARLRLARVLAYQGDYEAALATLDIDDSGEFAARLNEIKGDIHAAKGDMEAARIAYTNALTAPGAESIDRAFVEMKLSDLRSPDGGA